MKRLVCMALVFCLALCVFGGCGDKEPKDSSSAPSAVPTLAPTPTPARTAKAVEIHADGGLNVRDAASTDGEILGVAEDGSMLPLLVENAKDGWYQVQYQGKSAYVSAEYAQVKEISLEEYNKLKGSSSDDPDASKASSQPEGSKSGSSKSPSSQPEASQAESSRLGDSEDGE